MKRQISPIFLGLGPSTIRVIFKLHFQLISQPLLPFVSTATTLDPLPMGEQGDRAQMCAGCVQATTGFHSNGLCTGCNHVLLKF